LTPSLQKTVLNDPEATSGVTPTAGEGWITWTEAGASEMRLVAWSSTSQQAASVASAQVRFDASIGGGWLAWEDYGFLPDGAEAYGVYGLELSNLR
jgi:hypothetical protein